MDNYPWSRLTLFDWRRGSVLVRIFEGDQPRSQGFHLENGTAEPSPADEFGSRGECTRSVIIALHTLINPPCS